MSKKIKIEFLENGPIKVSGFSSIKYGTEILPQKDRALLCRCGKSKKQPFCDGKHKKANFIAPCKSSTTEELRIWEGKNIKTFFNKNLCMHVGYCAPLGELRLAEHFNNDIKSAKEIARVVALCPAGALTYEMKDGSVPYKFEDSDEIEIVKGGEIRIKCQNEGLETIGRQPENRMTLCRCGKSENKPFCDGKHKK